MVTLLARLTGDSALAEDLAQESFVKAFRNLASFDPARRFSSWLLRIAHNTGIDALRRQRLPVVPLETAGPDHQPLDPAAPETPDPLERQALAAVLESALAGLRPEFRVAVTLRYEEGLSFAEIGQVLGVPEATARSHVHRARKELANVLTEPERAGASRDAWTGR